jgi:hypothetical protein
MIILDTILVGGIKFVLRKIVDAVEAELDDDRLLREELLATQLRLELGEIDEDEFARRERALLDRIRELQARRRAASAADGDGLPVAGDPTEGGAFTVTVEATFDDDADDRDRR